MFTKYNIMGVSNDGDKELKEILSQKYPKSLNPFIVLGVNTYNGSINGDYLKAIFRQKMEGNEIPAYRLAYDMLVNQDNYTLDCNTMMYTVKNEDIFYFTHIGSIEGVQKCLSQNRNLLEQKDKLGRTIFYIAARNGYYELCKYLIEEGANINKPQAGGSTPFEGAHFYGHNKIEELIVQKNNNKNKIKNSITENRIEEGLKIEPNKNIKTINDFDLILQKNNFFNFIKEKHSSTIFNNISIFDKDKYRYIKLQFEHNFNYNNLSPLQRKCIGCMLGMAIGDALGARVEFEKLSYEYNGVKDMGKGIGGKAKLQPGQWTDDTSMGLCLADSLIENNGNFNGHDFMIRLICWWYFGYNNTFRFDEQRSKKGSIGLGGNVSGSFKKYLNEYGKNEYTTHGDKNTSGNGSIIRNAAIPICFYKNINFAMKVAFKQSKVTHQGDEAAGCCQLLTFIIVQILNGTDLKFVLNNLFQFQCGCPSVNCLAHSQMENNDPNRNWNWKDKNFKYSTLRAQSNPGYIGSYAMDAMAMTLHILFYTNNFREAILKGANLRGDADSVCAVIGQIAGAYYGLDNIPKDWSQTLYNWDKYKEIPLRAYILCNMIENTTNNFANFS